MDTALMTFDIVAQVCGFFVILAVVLFHERMTWLLRAHAPRVAVAFVILFLVRHGMEFAGVERNVCRLFGKVVFVSVVLFALRLSVPVVMLVAGFVSNGIATAANGLKMPVLDVPGAEELLWQTGSAGHVLAGASTRFLYLCDIIPVHARGELLNVQSVGDVLISLSVVLLLYRIVCFCVSHVKFERA